MSSTVPNAGTSASFKVVVTHVASEHKWVKLYVQKDYDSVREIEDYIEQNDESLCKQSGYLHQGQLPLGTPCFARFSDNKWYRAAVSAWPKSDATFVEVTFIDYGNPEIVSVADIRRGEEDVFLTPPLAMECFLDGIDVNLIPPIDASQLIEHTKGLLLYEEVTLSVLRYERFPNDCVRPIVSVTMPQGRQLVEILTAEGTVPPPPLSSPPPPPPAFKYLALPLDTTHEVYVSHVDDLENVYLHLSAKDPTDFTDRVQSYGASLPRLCSMHEGMACLSQFSEDGNLYRSLVSSVAGTTCRVLFVDYGNSEGKALRDLFSIPPALLEDPVYAHHCRVSNLTIDADTFRNVTADTPLTCKFVSRCGPTKYTVELSDIPGLQSPANSALLEQPMSIQKLRFEPDTTFVMYISFIESAEVMYGQLKETAEDIENISAQLAVECQTRSNEFVDVRPGAAVACVYEGTWYRAEVIEASQKVTVWIADYGDTVVLARSDLRPLDQKYLLQPAYAVKLTLEGYRCDPATLDAATSALQNLVLDVEVRVHVVESSPDGLHLAKIFVGDPPVSVTRKLPPPASSIKVPPPTLSAIERLTVMAVKPPRTFFGQLVKYSVEDLDALQESLLQHYSNATREAGFVPVVGQHVSCKFSEDGCFYRAKVTSVVPDGSCGVFYLDYGNEEVVAAENIYPLAAVFTQVPQFGIRCSVEGGSSGDAVSHLMDGEVDVRLVREDGEVHWVVLCGAPVGNVAAPEAPPAVPAAAVPPPAVHPQSAHVPSTMQPAEMAVGWTASVQVVFVISPAEFYCQLKAHEGELNALMDEIALLETEPPLSEASVQVNLPCVSLYSEDGGWYRARVRELRPGGALVFFVDYGNSEVVQCNSLRALPAQYTRLPEQAIKCKLAGVQPTIGSSWSEEATGKFDELVSSQTTAVKVVARCGICHEVDLTLPDGRTAAGVLTQEGLTSLGASPSRAPDVGFRYQSLVPGTPVEVAVSWVLNPGEVFIQPTSTADSLERLMEQLQVRYANSRPEDNLVRVGQACAAKFSEDGMWYRARVTHTKGAKFGVQYVDYGNCEEVNSFDVRKIEPSFVELPTQAVHCRIRGLHPPGPAWTALAPGSPLDDILSGILICRPTADQDGVHLVDFERPADGCNVADLLIAAGLARGFKENCGSVSEASVTSKPRMCIPPLEICFQTGQYVDVKVTAAVTVEEVWCRTLQALDPIAESLAEAAKSSKKLANPVSGDGCIASAPDGQWARAVVRARPSPAKIELFFVDIGIVQTVHHAKVKPMAPELTELPAQAFQCCLMADGRNVAGELLQTLVDKELVLEVRAVRDGCVVGSLFDTAGEEEVNVLDALATKDTLDSEQPVSQAAAPATSEVAPQPSASTSGVAVTTSQTDSAPERAPYRPPYNRGHIIVPCYTAVSKLAGKMAAYVMHVDDLNCFYVMRKDQETELENLTALIEQRYGGGNGEHVQLVPKMPCIAMSPADSQWYRAKIVNPVDDLRAVVHFIDYGNTEDTTELRAVASEFLEIPAFCYKCKLDGAKELFGIPGVVETFTELVSDAELEMEVVTWGHEVTVRLLRDGADVAAKLREQAVVEDAVGKQTEVSAGEGNVQASGDSAAEGAEKFNDSTQPENAEPVEAEPKDQASTEAPDQPFRSTFATTPIEGEVLCIISHVDAPDCFYASPADKQDALADFCAQVQDLLASKNVVVKDPKVGMPCCALYLEDEQWYRAVVVEAGDPLKVRFVDYGNCGTVGSVAEVPEEILHVPTFCFGCKLEGDFEGGDSTERLKDLAATEEHVRVKVVEWGEPATVKLFSSDGSGIGAQLNAEPTVNSEVEDIVPCSEKYAQPEVPLHAKAAVDVSHINGPLDFYVNLADHKEKMEEVATILEEPQSRGEQFDPAVNSPCTAVYTDGLTYRATVLDKSETEVRVLFVDYGNVESVGLGDVFCLPARLTTIPALAVHCRLDADASSLSTEEASERFRESVENSSSLLADFLRQEGDTFVVRLLDMGIDILTSISEKSAEAESISSVDIVQTNDTPEGGAAELGPTNDDDDSVFKEPAEESEKVEIEAANSVVNVTCSEDANKGAEQDVEPAVDSTTKLEVDIESAAAAGEICDVLAEDKLRDEPKVVPPGDELENEDAITGEPQKAEQDEDEDESTPVDTVQEEEEEEFAQCSSSLGGDTLESTAHSTDDGDLPAAVSCSSEVQNCVTEQESCVLQSCDASAACTDKPQVCDSEDPVADRVSEGAEKFHDCAQPENPEPEEAEPKNVKSSTPVKEAAAEVDSRFLGDAELEEDAAAKVSVTSACNGDSGLEAGKVASAEDCGALCNGAKSATGDGGASVPETKSLDVSVAPGVCTSSEATDP
ncbi:maternal protein tudor-like isoform X2 [Ornithodoros turicata]|uniref:maternal protein tudor-like isoform X2 n=1 Tax=Ornithodoros turicata TaxID=34597 RepID=UPI00313964FE